MGVGRIQAAEGLDGGSNSPLLDVGLNRPGARVLGVMKIKAAGRSLGDKHREVPLLEAQKSGADEPVVFPQLANRIRPPPG